MKAKFEVTVEDVKTSRIKDDTCPLSGEFTHDKKDVKVKMTFTAGDQSVFDSLFGDVGNIVTFSVVKNAQTSLADHEDPGEESDEEE